MRFANSLQLESTNSILTSPHMFLTNIPYSSKETRSLLRSALQPSPRMNTSIKCLSHASSTESTILNRSLGPSSRSATFRKRPKCTKRSMATSTLATPPTTIRRKMTALRTTRRHMPSCSRSRSCHS